MQEQNITLPSVGVGALPRNENYKVDIDDGAMIRYHPTGAAVYMLYRNPGVFLNDHNRPVPAEFAGAAGYDVEPLLRARRKREAQAVALEAIEAEYRVSAGFREVIKSAGDYSLVHVGNERYNVEFEDGSPMNTSGPLPLDVAEKTYMMLVGEETPPVKAKK
jgi:hypothetical protein